MMQLSDLGAELPEGVVDVLVSIVLFVVALTVVLILGRQLVVPTLQRMMATRDLEPHARRPLEKVTWFVIAFTAIATAFAAAGFGSVLRSLATIAAAATLAIGFALQDVIRNFVAGIFIFIERPFKIGDWIEWEDNVGIVEDVSLRVTRVRTFNNELLTVPNGVLTANVVKNPVAFNSLRLQVPFGIGYGDDVEAATAIIVEEAQAHPEILEDPAPSVRLVELGDSTVVLQSRIWIDHPSRSDFVKTQSEYTAAVKERFEAADIEIPFPQRDLSGAIDIGGEVATRTD